MSKISAMNVHGEVGTQKAPSADGDEVTYGPLYKRSLSMEVLKVKIPSNELLRMFKKEEVPKGGLVCSLYEDEGCIRPLKEFGPRFTATLLEKACLEDDLSKPKEEFYPLLRRLLVQRRNWGIEYNFRGMSTFIPCLMEWTESIMSRFKQPLKEAGIYGLVGVSQFPYYYRTNMWRAFCEQWSALTNTFHHGGGEIGISLNDLHQIGGLPILGDPYEEYVPPNEHLLDSDKYPSTVVELLRIHSELCQHNNTPEVSWRKWIRHFYRDEQVYSAYGVEQTSSSRKRKFSSPSSSKDKLEELLPLNVSNEGELAAFIALLLSRFVIPHGQNFVRPKTFVMASALAQGKPVSLAPAVLGHIYHGLGQIATHEGSPGSAKTNFGIHFVIGWLALYFRSLYPCRPKDEVDEELPLLAQYAGVQGHNLSLYQSRLTFRGTEGVFYRASNFGLGIESEPANTYSDSAELSNRGFEHLLTTRSAILPVRLGDVLILEPYYPNRFARQFGFDQGIPANNLRFSYTQRSKTSLEDIATAYKHLFRRNTGVPFYIPPNYHEGAYTYTYCGWWARVSAPYLTQSCHKIKTILTRQKSIEREPKYVFRDERIIVPGMRGAVRISEQRRQHIRYELSVKSPLNLYEDSSINIGEIEPVEESTRGRSPTNFFKMQRRRTRSEESGNSESVGFHASPIHGNFSISDDAASAEVDNTTFIEAKEAFPADNIQLFTMVEDCTATSVEPPQTQQPLNMDS